jgi:hypothetical protein
MAIILKANKVNLFVSSVLFVFWYHSPKVLDTPRASAIVGIEYDQKNFYFISRWQILRHYAIISKMTYMEWNVTLWSKIPQYDER